MSDQQQTVYQNESLDLVVKKQPNCRVIFEVNVKPPAADAAYRKAIKNVSKEISIPGFRKGKAPEKVILEHFSQDIDREWHRLVLNLAFNDSMELSGCQPLDNRAIGKPTLKRCSRTEGAEVTVNFESKPDVHKINPQDFHVDPVAIPEITDEHRERELYNLRSRYGEYRKVDHETIQEGDIAVLDVDALREDGTTNRICTDERFVVEQGVLAGWMRQLLVGAKVGQTLEGVTEPDEETKADEPFVPVKCRIFVKEILNHILPEVDDALAKKVGCADTVELSTNMTKMLQTRAEQWAHQQEIQQLENQILEHYPIELPLSLLENTVSVSVKNTLYGLKKLNVPEERIRALESQIRSEARVRAERDLKLRLLLESTVHEQKLTLTRDDLLKELKYQEYLAPPEEKVINSDMTPEEMSQQIANLLFFRKAKEFLLQEVRKRT